MIDQIVANTFHIIDIRHLQPHDPALYRHHDLVTLTLPNPGDGLIYTDGFTVDSLFTASSSNAIIGFCISSNSPSPNSESYQVIVSADRHELLYYKRRRYKDGAKRGFTSKELKAIQAEHAYRK